MDRNKLHEVAKQCAQQYASPHHMTFSLSGLETLVEKFVGPVDQTGAEEEPASALDPSYKRQVEIISLELADILEQAGIYNGKVSLTGPMLLLLMGDLKTFVAQARSSQVRAFDVGVEACGNTPYDEGPFELAAVEELSLQEASTKQTLSLLDELEDARLNVDSFDNGASRAIGKGINWIHATLINSHKPQAELCDLCAGDGKCMKRMALCNASSKNGISVRNEPALTVMPELPGGLIRHAKLGAMYDRLQMQHYAMKYALSCGLGFATPKDAEIEGAAGDGTKTPCQNSQHMGKFACKDKSQYWEPCGELGKSAAHAKVVVPVEGKGMFEVGIANRKWHDLQTEGYRMKTIHFGNGARTGEIDAWGKVIWKN